MKDEQGITALINANSAADGATERDLYAVIYAELRKIARSHRRNWHGDETLNTTALIGEAYLKLAGGKPTDWNSRRHFYATAAKAMRQILVNYSQRRRAAKRGGDAVQVPLEENDLVDDRTASELISVHYALEKMEEKNARACRVVECRVFAGMTAEETADALQVSLSTVKRDWADASLELSEAFRAE